MTLDLSQVEFLYDYFSVEMPSGDTLVLNKIDENFLADTGLGTQEAVAINGINIVIEQEEQNIVCPTVIGTSNDYISIDTLYLEYLGHPLTKDNMKYCTIEMFEEEDD